MKIIAETPLEEQLLARIKGLSDEMAIQNNLSTAFPVWYVSELKKQHRPDGEGSVKERIDSDAIDYNKLCESCQQYSEDYDELPEDCDHYKCADTFWSYDLEREYTSYGSCFFLTEKACQEYIDDNKYHFNDPRPYADSAFRNDEVQDIIHMLLLAGGNDIPRNHYGELR